MLLGRDLGDDMPWPWTDGCTLWLTLNQAVFRDVDVIAVGQEPIPLASFPLVIRLGEPWALLV